MGRDIQAIKISGEDRRKYRDKVRRSLDVFARMLRERRFDETPNTVGQEIELNLTDEHGMPSMRNADVLERDRQPGLGHRGRASSTWRSTCRRGCSTATRWTSWRPSSAPTSTRPTPGRAPPAATWSWSASCPRWPNRTCSEDAMSANARYKAAQRADLRRPRRGHADRDRRRRAAAHLRGQHHPRGRLHQRAAARPGQPGRLRALLERGPGHRGRAGGAGGELPVPVRQASCGTRPGSRCSSRPPTPARTSSRSRACGPGCGSASAGSPRCSTCSRRTSGTSRRCCRSARTRTRCAVLDAGRLAAAGRDDACTTAPSTGGTGRSTTSRTARPHLRVENRVLPAGPTVADMLANAAFYYGLVRVAGRGASGRSGPRCRSPPPRRTCTRPRGTASTPSCTGRAWARPR